MILIYGKGKVGTAAAALCQHLQKDYEIKDDTDELADFSAYSFIIPSPGISPKHPIYQTGKILGELDFAYEHLPEDVHIFSITGTDGKSTTSWLLYQLLCDTYGEEKVFLSGNFDIPFSQTVKEIREKGLKKAYIVLEVSSFMAYNIHSFQSDYAIFTNFAFDHLNWHMDLSDYFSSKMKLVRQVKKWAFCNTQIQELAPLEITSANKLTFFGKNSQENFVRYPKISIHSRDFLSLKDTPFAGEHNAYNILSVALIGDSLGISWEEMKRSFSKMKGLPHRLEVIAQKKWVTYIDDGKSTSAQSLTAALGSFTQPVILIAGGSDKWDPFNGLDILLAEKVKYAFFMGQTREILGEISGRANVLFEYVENMSDAVNKASDIAQDGDIVLLSPGCASFGLFKDYLDRAHQYHCAVDSLAD